MPCPECGKKIMFGMEDVGSDAFCPHCDTPVVLRAPGAGPAPPPKPRTGPPMVQLIGIPAGIFVVVFSLIAGVGLLKRSEAKKGEEEKAANMSDEEWLAQKKREAREPEKKKKAKKKAKKTVPMLKGYKRPLNTVTKKEIKWTNPTKRDSGSPVQLMGHMIENAESGNLTFVVGMVQNHTDQQLFDVEAFFDLYDKGGKKVGDTKDYMGILAPKAKWELRATVFQRNVKSAKLRKLVADK
ncbi:MAG: hypothetical protein CMO80_10125 [Verrucomicrobiales bacterium]|nr:hypothetical protein [Verrucomicrobiales bacterium]|tara:strand:+ start:283 stop:1002 length:720 start_codon:yes stop_codon:yes gene_type:complete